MISQAFVVSATVGVKGRLCAPCFSNLFTEASALWHMKNPIHQIIPTDVILSWNMVPNDLQELIRRIPRLSQKDKVEFVSTLWSWWRQQPIPSKHPRIPEHELLRKFLKIRAEVLHVPAKQFHVLQIATYNIFLSTLVSESYPEKTIRSDLFKKNLWQSRSNHGDPTVSRSRAG